MNRDYQKLFQTRLTQFYLPSRTHLIAVSSSVENVDAACITGRIKEQMAAERAGQTLVEPGRFQTGKGFGLVQVQRQISLLPEPGCALVWFY